MPWPSHTSRNNKSHYLLLSTHTNDLTFRRSDRRGIRGDMNYQLWQSKALVNTAVDITSEFRNTATVELNRALMKLRSQPIADSTSNLLLCLSFSYRNLVTTRLHSAFFGLFQSWSTQQRQILIEQSTSLWKDFWVSENFPLLRLYFRIPRSFNKQ